MKGIETGSQTATLAKDADTHCGAVRRMFSGFLCACWRARRLLLGEERARCDACAAFAYPPFVYPTVLGFRQYRNVDRERDVHCMLCQRRARFASTASMPSTQPNRWPCCERMDWGIPLARTAHTIIAPDRANIGLIAMAGLSSTIYIVRARLGSIFSDSSSDLYHGESAGTRTLHRTLYWSFYWIRYRTLHRSILPGRNIPGHIRAGLTVQYGAFVERPGQPKNTQRSYRRPVPFYHLDWTRFLNDENNLKNERTATVCVCSRSAVNSGTSSRRPPPRTITICRPPYYLRRTRRVFIFKK